MAIEEVIGKCIHKVMSEDENSTTFKDINNLIIKIDRYINDLSHKLVLS